MLDNPWVLPPMPEGYFGKERAPGHSSGRAQNRALNAALAASTVFLVVVFPALLAQSLSGGRLPGLRLVVAGGNAMEPAIRPGALMLARATPFETLSEGDIIVYAGADGAMRTNRVVGREYGCVRAKGDSALFPDAQPVTPEMYRYRVLKVFNGFAALSLG